MSTRYYMMEYYTPPGKLGTLIDTWPSIPGVRSWKTGARFPVAIPNPLRFALNTAYGFDLPPMFNSTVLLMSNALLESLSSAGVDNLDVYDAVITDPRNQREHLSHRAVNIIGSVAAANLDESGVALDQPDRMISVDFEGVVIDDSKTRGALLFRLAQCVTGIVVHERVKNHVEKQSFSGLRFIDPIQWIG